MQRAAKENAVTELVEVLGSSRSVILADYRGLSVARFTELRRALAHAGARCRVVKNTLLRRALEAQPEPQSARWPALEQHLVGPVAAVFIGEDPVAPTKELMDFIRRHGLPRVNVGLVDGQLLGPDQVQAVATLPPRPELLARLVGSLQSPVAGLVSTLQSLTGRLTLTLMAIVEQRQTSAPAEGAA